MLKCIGCLIYDSSKQMFLLQQRSKNTTHPLKLSMWGGKMEIAESFSSALKRELLEEIGCTPEYDKLYPLDIFLANDNKFIYYSFLMIVHGLDEIEINPNETFDYIWMPYHYILRLDLHPGLRKTFEKKKKYIKDVIELYH